MPQNSSVESPAPASVDSAYSESKLAAADLDQYYSLLFAPSPRRQRLTALYAWWQELREIPIECSDPEVARVKLAWWHEEMHALYAGKPRHPVAIALRGAIAEHELPAALFFEIIESLARHAGIEHYGDDTAIRTHARETRGTVERLAARILGAVDDSKVAHLGATLELVRLLRDTGLAAQRGRSYFADEELRRFDATLGDVMQGRPTEAMRTMLASRAQTLRRELGEARDNLPAEAIASLTPLLVATDLALALLDRIHSDPTLVLREQPRLSPARRLWIAWRTARRSKRGRR